MTGILSAYGWNDLFAERLAALGAGAGAPGRVVVERRGVYGLQTARGAIDAVVAGRLRHLAADGGELPVVGDWVAFTRPDPAGMALVGAVLPRATRLSRKVAGARAVEQVIAANVDRIVVVMGLDGDFNPRRLERYLVMCRDSGARPIVLLNKADLCADLAARAAAAEAIAGGAPVRAVSALSGDLAGLSELLVAGETVALVGSSGAGKSTLVNRLAGEELLPTAPVRERDERGRHTTTHRELFLLPGGTLLIDNPGIRELQLWEAGEGLDEAFEDVARLAAGCRFRDCSHATEPGCAVLAAIESGELDERRLRSFQALAREAEALAARRDVRARREADRRLGKLYKTIQAEKSKRGNGW